jgi:hypothetical protein
LNRGGQGRSRDGLRKLHAVTAQLSNGGKGLARCPKAYLWLSSPLRLG